MSSLPDIDLHSNPPFGVTHFPLGPAHILKTFTSQPISAAFLLLFCPLLQCFQLMGEGAKAMASLYWREISQPISRGQRFSGTTGGAPACNGFHSWGTAGPRLCAAKTR